MMGIMNGVDMTIEIKEGITFNNFDTRENDMYLIDRSAPTPAEKEIIENVPFAHGVYDFSNILGERIFSNRPISYTFHIHEHDYDRRKHEQTVLENKLLGTHITQLEDTHDSSYYYLGKCVSVSVEDDHEYGRLIVNIDFDCYPFKISKLPEGHDIWDEFNFELDVSQIPEFEVNGSQEVTLYNTGASSVVPTIKTSSEFTIEIDTISVTVSAGTHKSELIRLRKGENRIMLTGNGTIEFDFYKELI